MKRLSTIFFISTLFLASMASSGFAESSKILKTKYTTIHYNNDNDLSDFLWRLGGTRIDLSTDRGLASSRVDRIVERVETIIDMRPKNLNIDIYLQRGDINYNEVAFYQYKNNSVYFSIDKVSDGVFAHEISHAIINHYFTTPIPSKIQEIITQYVDRYLWSDY